MSLDRDSGVSRRLQVLVVGGGVGGLVAARHLASSLDVVLADDGPLIGGKVRTTEFRGRSLDTGPDVFITRNPEAEALCRELGLGDELIAPSTSKAAVWARGALRPFPGGLAVGIPTDLGELWRSGVVTRRDVVRAAADLVPRGRVASSGLGQAASGGEDVSIAAVVRPRLGNAVFDTLAAPLLGGINAGDAELLSFEATVPDLARAIAGRRRLMPALRRFASNAQEAPTRPMFLGLKGGLATLVERLEDTCTRLGAKIEQACTVGELIPTNGRWHTTLNGREVVFDGVVVAVGAHDAARLLRAASPALSIELGAVSYAGVVTVTFAWPKEALASSRVAQLAGAGVLNTDRTMLTTALTFTSTKWPRSSNAGEIVIRASAGRYGDERAMSLGDDELESAIRKEIAVILGIDQAPLSVHIERFPDSFPQYVVGHLHRVARIEALADELATVVATGSWAHGIGIPSCIGEAKRAASKLAAALAR